MVGIGAWLLMRLPQIIMGVAILAVVGTLYWWARDNGYKSAEAKLKPQLIDCKTALQTETDANNTLRTSLAALDQKYAGSQAELERIGKIGGEVRGAVTAAVVAAEKRGAEAQKKSSDYAARALAASTNTPEVQCANANSILGDIADRMRGH